jgi:carbonic anhydrase
MYAPEKSPAAPNLKPVYALLTGICILLIPILGLSGFAVDRMCDSGSCFAYSKNGLTAVAEKASADDGGYTYSDPNKDWSGVCASGMAQSPINLVASEAVTSDTKPKIKRGDFLPVDATVKNAFANSAWTKNAGHTILVDNIDSYFQYNSVDYKLLQFHLHTKSEHTLEGKQSDAEVHFVHQNLKGELLVIGVMINEGSTSPNFLAQMAQNTKKDKGVNTQVSISMSGILNDLNLDATSTPYWTWAGSLTTPPCSEGVTWIILKSPLTATASDISAIVAIEGANARPTQPLNGRVVNSVV